MTTTHSLHHLLVRGVRAAALLTAIVLAAVTLLTAGPASAQAAAPAIRTAPGVPVTTVAVGNTVRATAPTFTGTVTRIDYAWEYCRLRAGAALSCTETGVPGTRYTPTLASTGGMTLTQWSAATYYVRVRAVGYNGALASRPTWSTLVRVVPGIARGAINVVEWWNSESFGVYGIAAADGVDGAIPFRLRAISSNGTLVASVLGRTGQFRTDYRATWPNTGNWGGFNSALHRSSAARTVCLDVGQSLVPVQCLPLPARPATPPPIMTGAG